MAETEPELRRQEIERDSLQGTVSGLQAAIMFATGEHRMVLEVALRNATSHLGAVERKVRDLRTAYETEVRSAAQQELLGSARLYLVQMGFAEEPGSAVSAALDDLQDAGRLRAQAREEREHGFGNAKESEREAALTESRGIERLRDAIVSDVDVQARMPYLSACETHVRDALRQLIPKRADKRHLAFFPIAAIAWG